MLNDTERKSNLERDLIPPVSITMVTVGECLTGTFTLFIRHIYQKLDCIFLALQKYFYAHYYFNNTNYAELTHIVILERTVDAKEVS